MSTKAQNATVIGTGNQVLMSHRDVVIGDQYVLANTQFFEPDLLDVKPPRFEGPPIADQLVSDLLDFPLLVLGGRRLREKGLFARHLGWRLSQRLLPEKGEVSVKQWHPGSGTQHLEDAFAEHKSTTVFVFPGMQPHHVGHDLRPLLDTVERHRHYAIISTDSEYSHWSLDHGEVERRFWRKYSTREVYGEDYLLGLLLKGLERARAHLPDGLLPSGLEEDAALVEGLPLREAAMHLETPSRVRSFVAALCADPAAGTAERIRDKLRQLGGDQHAVHRWYHRLKPREQLLALGLALFDGLFEDQVFAALEILVDGPWRARDPNLAHFDYHELARVGAYFHGTQPGFRTTRIESHSPAHRRAVLEMSWQLHRRRLLTTLPWVVELVKDSAAGPAADSETPSVEDLDRDEKKETKSETVEPESEKSPNPPSDQETHISRWVRPGPWRELFGSPIRNAQFRRSASETFSYVGLLSAEAVERSLLDLAEDSRREVQVVAATALARWREKGPQGATNERQLFRILAAWQNEAFLKEHSRGIRRSGPAAVRAMANIRATVVLALGYASLHDRPGELADPLVRLVGKLVHDRNLVVRERFRSQTLPLVVAGHLEQLEELLVDEVLLELDLLSSVASGMAYAAVSRPDETLPLLDRWRNVARESPRLELDDDEVSRRETRLATVAMAWGRMKPTADGRGLTAQEIFDRLRGVVAKESHPFVRHAVLLAMMLQADQGFCEVAPYMDQLVSEVVLRERDFVVDQLTELYLRQRQKLSGGDDKVAVDGVVYPVWLEKKRPRTEVEKLLDSWLLNPGKPVAQQLALKISAQFRETALERAERDLAEERKNQPEDKREEAAAPKAARSVARADERLLLTPWLAQIAIFIIAPFAPRKRARLHSLVPQYFEHCARGGEPDRLFGPWSASGDAALLELVDDLQKVARIYRRRYQMVAAVVVLLFAAVAAVLYFPG